MLYFFLRLPQERMGGGSNDDGGHLPAGNGLLPLEKCFAQEAPALLHSCLTLLILNDLVFHSHGT